MSKRTSTINNIGVSFDAVDGDQRLRSIRIYPEGGAVQIWVEVFALNGCAEETHTAMQYLLPEEAMSLAKGLDRSAIQALRDVSE